MTITLDNLITKYMNTHIVMMGHLESVDNGVIPFGDTEGAPATLEEARQGIGGIAFATEQIINDLLELKLTLTYDEAEKDEESNLSVD